VAATNRRLAIVLVVASVAWPVLLASATWPQAVGRPAAWSAVVYLAASRVCHQLPERSFHTAGVQWPVCGRCSGLYLAAPLGALAGVLVSARRLPDRRAVVGLTAAALPALVTFGLEHLTTVPVGNVTRLLTALPLGATVAFVIVRVAAGGHGGTIEYTHRP